MARKIIAAAVLAALTALPAMADDEPSKWTLGVHVYTQHNKTKPWFANRNPGLQLRRDDGLTLGFYCNSYSRTGQRAWDAGRSRCELTTYVGWMFETSRDRLVGVGIAPTALYGYDHGIRLFGTDHRVLLHPMPNLRIGPARVYMLSPNDFHLAFEWRF